MNAFDETILHLLNSLAQRSSFLDRGMMLLANGTVAKASFVGLFLWYPWLEEGEEGRRNREIIVATVFGCFVSIALCLVLQKLLPYRVRPVQNAELGFLVPIGQEPLKDWPSAFPSDHAQLSYSEPQADGTVRLWTRDADGAMTMTATAVLDDA